jgi:hypothetical protein
VLGDQASQQAARAGVEPALVGSALHVTVD